MQLKRRKAFAHQVRALALGRLQQHIDETIDLAALPDLDPYAAAERVLERIEVRAGSDAYAARTGSR